MKKTLNLQGWLWLFLQVAALKCWNWRKVPDQSSICDKSICGGGVGAFQIWRPQILGFFYPLSLSHSRNLCYLCLLFHNPLPLECGHHKWKPPCMAVWWKRWWQTRRHNTVHTTELHSPSPSLSQSVALRRLRCSDLPIEVKKVLKKKNCCRRGSGRSAR